MTEKSAKKQKMTLDKLARMTQGQFSVIQKDMATKDDLKELRHGMVMNFATKDDLKHFATKDDMKLSEVRILQAVDIIATKFDKAEKEEAAHTMLHKRITDGLHGHDQRIKKLEAKL
ncbi:MAG: hypothetical protein HYW88_01200 [Candidatus Sungbacteria bacterium]|nr:hypothetical protein [Candidatus Sungbacteria bacterium]